MKVQSLQKQSNCTLLLTICGCRGINSVLQTCIPSPLTLRSADRERDGQRAAAGRGQLLQFPPQPGDGGHVHQPQLQPAVLTHGENAAPTARPLVRSPAASRVLTRRAAVVSGRRALQVPQPKPLCGGGHGQERGGVCGLQVSPLLVTACQRACLLGQSVTLRLVCVCSRYRHWKLGDDIDLVVRCEHDGVMTGANGEVSFVNVKTLNEWDSRVRL